jgi:glutathione S-transferase
MMQRFDKLEQVLEGREWLATSGFTIADILMADVLRIPNDLGDLEKYPALRGYLTRPRPPRFLESACWSISKRRTQRDPKTVEHQWRRMHEEGRGL